MMKNNKGFTLVELLAIVVILALIAVIAAPNMTKQIRENEENTQNILNQKIENAAHLYAGKYYADKLINGEEVSFTLNDLQLDGLVDLKDNCDGVLNNNITINSSGYHYTNIEADNCYKNNQKE